MHMPLRGHPVKQMQKLQIFPTENYIYGMNKYSKFEKSLHFPVTRQKNLGQI